MATWSELLNDYRAQRNKTKQELVHATQQQLQNGSRRKYRDGRFNLLDKQRQFNPVKSQYVDPNKDHERRIQEEEAMMRRIALKARKGMERGIERDYNIVQHQPRTKGLTPQPLRHDPVTGRKINPDKPRKVPLDSVTPWNILSNDPLPHHPNKKELERMEAEKQPTLQARVETREYDILSNRRHEAHEQHEKAARLAVLETAKQRMFRKCPFNPLTATFNDPSQEQRQQQTEQEKAAYTKSGERLKRTLPPAIAMGEGRLYDITTNQVKEPRDLSHFDRKLNRSVNRRRPGYAYESLKRVKSEEEEARKLLRGLRRVSDQRFHGPDNRDYNLLTNLPVNGRTGKPRPAPHTKPRPKLWTTLQRGGRHKRRPSHGSKEPARRTPAKDRKEHVTWIEDHSSAQAATVPCELLEPETPAPAEQRVSSEAAASSADNSVSQPVRPSLTPTPAGATSRGTPQRAAKTMAQLRQLPAGRVSGQRLPADPRRKRVPRLRAESVDGFPCLGEGIAAATRKREVVRSESVAGFPGMGQACAAGPQGLRTALLRLMAQNDQE